MGFKKPTEVHPDILINAVKPSHGKKYSVIEHKYILDKTKEILNDHNFKINKEVYRANMNANVAQGVIYLEHKNAFQDTGMMFGWTNSYDKSVRFQCAIGAYVMVCSNLMVSGEISYGRKHIGSALADIDSNIEYQVKNAHSIFNNIEQDKMNMQQESMSFQQQCAIAGLLYIDEDIINNQQLNIIKQEMHKPSFDYNADLESAWSFYNHVTHALKTSHPKQWMKKSKQFHTYMTTKYLNNISRNSSDIIDLSEFGI
tara:strand:- start:5647 stop:6417 length:771 start_codon:yes stop_codon:yes gene_type:complete